jgi:hypothetical protein
VAKGSIEPFGKPSADTTAETVGVSAATVKKVRAINDSGEADLIALLSAGKDATGKKVSVHRVYVHDFLDEDAAVDYAIAAQRNRRNLSSAGYPRPRG